MAAAAHGEGVPVSGSRCPPRTPGPAAGLAPGKVTAAPGLPPVKVTQRPACARRRLPESLGRGPPGKGRAGLC